MTQSKHLQRVTAEQGDRLRAAGFNWPCTMYYDADGKLCEGDLLNHNYGGAINAPTVALALKWMRDMKGMFGVVSIFFGYDEHGMPYDEPRYGIEALDQSRTSIVDIDDYMHNGAAGYPTYESAESALLDELLTLIER